MIQACTWFVKVQTSYIRHIYLLHVLQANYNNKIIMKNEFLIKGELKEGDDTSLHMIC